MVEWVSTGVSGVDELLDSKGIPWGHTVLVSGGPGSGKMGRKGPPTRESRGARDMRAGRPVHVPWTHRPQWANKSR